MCTTARGRIEKAEAHCFICIVPNGPSTHTFCTLHRPAASAYCFIHLTSHDMPLRYGGIHTVHTKYPPLPPHTVTHKKCRNSCALTRSRKAAPNQHAAEPLAMTAAATGGEPARSSPDQPANVVGEVAVFEDIVKPQVSVRFKGRALGGWGFGPAWGPSYDTALFGGCKCAKGCSVDRERYYCISVLVVGR